MSDVQETQAADPAIELTGKEQEMLAEITLDTAGLDFMQVRSNGETVCRLTLALIERGAIPEPRRRYFLDPEYNIGGRGASRMDIFEKNGTRGRAVFAHPNFLPFFTYFLFGPKLPRAVIETFRSEVEEFGTVTSGDILPLGECARREVQKRRLNPHYAAEEIFKLALECELDVDDARVIRDAARRLC